MYKETGGGLAAGTDLDLRPTGYEGAEERLRTQWRKQKITLKHSGRFVSYNIEMTEVTGGTFWKAYTPGRIAGIVNGAMVSVAALAIKKACSVRKKNGLFL